jgi:hypothetical protein
MFSCIDNVTNIYSLAICISYTGWVFAVIPEYKPHNWCLICAHPAFRLIVSSLWGGVGGGVAMRSGVVVSAQLFGVTTVRMRETTSGLVVCVSSWTLNTRSWISKKERTNANRLFSVLRVSSQWNLIGTCLWYFTFGWMYIGISWYYLILNLN